MNPAVTPAKVYELSDGALTRQLYDRLEAYGPIGVVAVNLFRAQKSSSRAKVYRGGIRGKGSFRNMAYERKKWAMDNLCKVLAEHGSALGISYGWREDPETPFGGDPSWVLYVDLPVKVATAACDMSAAALEAGAQMEVTTHQVSFHTIERGAGPNYHGEWDKQGQSAQRIIAFCDRVLGGKLKL